MRAVVANRRSRSYRRWSATVGATTLLVVAAAGALMLRDLSDRSTLPGLDSFLRFELPSTGAVYDARGTLLLEVAHEKRSVVSYGEIPAVVRQAVLAVEDKNFFSHRGVDVSVLPRVVMRNLRSILADWRRALLDGSDFHVSFHQGGSTITQQVVRGYFLTDITRRENDAVLLRETPLTRLAALVIGVRATNKLWRKVEEIRLSVWLEDELTRRLGSRQEAKRLIFAHYANAIYLGNGRYGLAAASDYYFGRPLGSLTDADVDKAALLAATIKNPRAYAPSSPDASRVLQRRDEALALMQRSGYLSAAALRRWQQEPMPPTAQPAPKEDSATACATPEGGQILAAEMVRLTVPKL